MDDQKDLKLSVIIPTYNRVDYLDRCLKYIERQEHKPLEVLPIVRDYDKLTTDYLKKTNLSINIKPVFLKINYSFVDALNRGMEMASGDIFVFTDDDAFAPSTKWLTVIYDSYKSDDQIAAIGGPVIPFRDDKPIKQYVNIWGKINWYGKMLGETTSIPTSVMECDVIRGANMSYRKSVVREFDKHLLPYWAKNEDAQTFYIKANGGKIITHPDAYVFHQVAPRVMDRASLETIFGYSFNSVYIYMRYLPGWKKPFYLIYNFIFMAGDSSGILTFALKLLLLKISYIKYRIFKTSILGKISGLLYYLSRHYKYST